MYSVEHSASIFRVREEMGEQDPAKNYYFSIRSLNADTTDTIYMVWNIWTLHVNIPRQTETLIYIY